MILYPNEFKNVIGGVLPLYQNFNRHGKITCVNTRRFTLRYFLCRFQGTLIRILSSIMLNCRGPNCQGVQIRALLRLISSLRGFNRSARYRRLDLGQSGRPVQNHRYIGHRRQRQKKAISRSVVRFLLLTLSGINWSGFPPNLISWLHFGNQRVRTKKGSTGTILVLMSQRIMFTFRHTMSHLKGLHERTRQFDRINLSIGISRGGLMPFLAWHTTRISHNYDLSCSPFIVRCKSCLVGWRGMGGW